MGGKPGKTAKGKKPLATQPRPKSFQKDYGHIRILVNGDSNTGKTSLVDRFLSDCFLAEGPPGGVAQEKHYPFKLLYHGRERSGTMVLVDSSAQERYRVMNFSWRRRARATITTYDINCYRSWSNVKRWQMEDQRYDDCIKCSIIVRTKSDLRVNPAPKTPTHSRYFCYWIFNTKTVGSVHQFIPKEILNIIVLRLHALEHQEAIEYQKALKDENWTNPDKITKYCEAHQQPHFITSAKDNTNVKETFDTLLEMIFDEMDKDTSEEDIKIR